MEPRDKRQKTLKGKEKTDLQIPYEISDADFRKHRKDE